MNKYFIFFLLLLSISSVYPMYNYKSYKKALCTRYDPNRVISKQERMYLACIETIADFAPVIELAITESGLAEKCIKALPRRLICGESTKHNIAHSLKNGARTAAFIAVFNGIIPYDKEKSYSTQVYRDPEKRKQESSMSENFLKETVHAWNKQTGLPFVSPVKNALIYTSVYVAADMSTDLLMQSETAQKAIDAIPGARTVHNAFKNNVDIKPGTGAALMVCGITWLARMWMGK